MLQNDPIAVAQQQIRRCIEQAVAKAVAAKELPQGELPSYTIEIPADTSHGDFATNLAMVGAKSWRMAPPKIAEIIVKQLDFTNTDFTKASIAGPGFINFTVDPVWFSKTVSLVNKLSKNYGDTNYGQGKKVMVEFVSANPTGIMHVGNARGGVTGDCLASVLTATGHKTDREFYLNDAGNQILQFGKSLDARFMEHLGKRDPADFPEDGYQGEDVKESVNLYIQTHGTELANQPADIREKTLADFVVPHNAELMKKTLERYRVVYDTWFSEKILHDTGKIDKMIALMKEKGLIYEGEGAVWYKATQFGGEKDEVLLRQNGTPTYFAADIAYHYDKFVTRGYDAVINFWGADHHGHVARLKGVMDAIGLSGDALTIVLFQHVRLMKDGEPFRMSKRTGKAVTLSDLLDMVPVDAVRFMFSMSEIGSTVDFDLDLAVEQSSQNPVYYVQYAHARICSLLKRAEEEGTTLRTPTEEELALLTAPEEIALIREIAKLPSLLVQGVKRCETASLPHYVMEIASLFHKFYSACHVNVEDESLKQARLALCTASQTTLAKVLSLMKITAPDSM